MIEFQQVNYIYEPGTPYELHAVKNVSLHIGAGEFVAVLGHTGSGKSTLVQHFNGLVRPTGGRILFRGQDIFEPGYSLKQLRSKVGLVFQYPEHQLFEVSVLADVCFGPKNLGLSKEECLERAKQALALVGLDERVYEMSPFELSGGQKRRVAIAGVLAMDPEVLILDEPSAGLDPKGRDEILNQVAFLQKEKGLTVILVSHSMDEVARYAQRVIVMDGGEKKFDGPTREVFSHVKELETMGLDIPQCMQIMHRLKDKGWEVPTDVLTTEEARDEILRYLHKKSLQNKEKQSGQENADASQNGFTVAFRTEEGGVVC